MNNKIIAMAIAAGLAFPLSATAGVKVGGHMQIELNQPDLKDNISDENDDLKLTDNARGRLRISGDEDLGGGMKAIFLAEWRINTDEGGGPRVSGSFGSNRESYVGIKGGFGTFYAGNSASPYKGNAGTDYDPYTASVLEGRGNGGALTEEGSMTKAYGINSFLQNSLNYKKKIGAFKLHVQYHLNENTKNTTVKQDNTIAFAGRYKINAAMEAIVAYIQESRDKTATVKLGGTRTKVGFSWKGGPHKVNARYETQADDSANNDVTAAFLGYHLTMGKNVLTIQYGTIDGKQAADDKTYQLLAVKHKFSKKTDSWVGYRNTDFNTANTSDNSVISFGLRVKF